MQQEKVWDKIAEQWFHFRQQRNIDVYNFFNKYCNKKGSVLEISCGNSRNLLPFAKSNFKCYGVDFSKKMIESSKLFAKKYDIKINLKKANMLKLPFKSNYFNYCLSIASIHHLEKKNHPKALKELYRVLKPKGICLISVWNKKSKKSYISWKIKGKIYKRYYYFFKEKELKDLILKAGFKILENYSNKNIVFILEKS